MHISAEARLVVAVPADEPEAARTAADKAAMRKGKVEMVTHVTANHRQAHLLQQRDVPLRVVESAFLQASLRRLLRPKNVPPLSPIRALAYFLPPIKELLADPSPDSYLDYLRIKLNRIVNNKDKGNDRALRMIKKDVF